MGAHRARPSARAARLAGRGALTAAAALALAGGTASLAFADEAPASSTTTDDEGGTYTAYSPGDVSDAVTTHGGNGLEQAQSHTTGGTAQLPASTERLQQQFGGAGDKLGAIMSDPTATVGPDTQATAGDAQTPNVTNPGGAQTAPSLPGL